MSDVPMPRDLSEEAVARFRCGDHVLHRPSNEQWLLACDEYDGEVICCGWPETFARASDCTLLKAATDEERLKLLREVAREGRNDSRASRARYDLSKAAPRG